MSSPSPASHSTAPGLIAKLRQLQEDAEAMSVVPPWSCFRIAALRKRLRALRPDYLARRRDLAAATSAPISGPGLAVAVIAAQDGARISAELLSLAEDWRGAEGALAERLALAFASLSLWVSVVSLILSLCR